jgi:hypothetical protein
MSVVVNPYTTPHGCGGWAFRLATAAGVGCFLNYDFYD